MQLIIKKYTYVLIILLYSYTSGFLWAQQITTEQTPQLVIKSRVKGNTVLLRWAVNEQNAWKLGNEYGYIIERTTVLRNGEPVGNLERVILSGGAIKPKLLPEWETVVTSNDMAGVAAQAIYGEDFELSKSQNPVLQIMHESQELERRFAFAMYAMDQSFEAAQYAGLGYVDTTVEPNAKYLYKIVSAVPKEIMNIKEKTLLVNTNDIEALPTPDDLAGYYFNNSFVLVWEYETLLEYYASYDLEKSEDGQNFTKINSTPITKLAETTVSGISYTDTIAAYQKKYWYRVRGISYFNEKSAPSKAISLSAFDQVKSPATFKENKMLSDTSVELSWEFPAEEEPLLQQFDLLRADKAIGPYTTVKEAIPPATRTLTYSELEPINYFKIKAIGKGGDFIGSSPNMVQPVDSIPPARPNGLRGTIDTLGIVRLTWGANTEKDLKGYKVYRANTAKAEFSQLNKYAFTETIFTDTIATKSFNTKVYYQIAALDKRYNSSPFSDTLILTRPDNIPPTAPVFNGYKNTTEGIALTWTNSSSQDVVKQLIYRRSINDQNATDQWENIFETTTGSLKTFIDRNVLPNSKYAYTLVAVDQVGLESIPSPAMTVSTPKNLNTPDIKGFYGSVDRENRIITLTWRYQETGLSAYRIYKKDGEDPFLLYKTVTPNQKQFVDEDLKLNSTYGYAIEAVFNDGSVSKWTSLEVVY